MPEEHWQLYFLEIGVVPHSFTDNGTVVVGELQPWQIELYLSKWMQASESWDGCAQ